MAIFVPATAKGDEINAHILKVKKTFAFAKADEILIPSPDRTEAECPVFLKCGGCAFQHITYDAEAKIKENHVKECFHRIAGMSPEFEPIIRAEKVYGYRNKAQFPVEIDGDEIKIGFYANHSHRVVHCPGCALQPDEFGIILSAFEKYIKDFAITSYNEESGKGLLRHIYIRKGTKSGEIMVCPVINGNSLPGENELVSRLLEVCPAITCVSVNINKENTNVIMGKICRTLYGKGYIEDDLCGCTFRISASSFYQINPVQTDVLYSKAIEFAGLTGNENVIDAYCGIGTIGLVASKHAKTVIGCEINPDAILDAKTNAKINNADNVVFICEDAGEFMLKMK